MSQEKKTYSEYLVSKLQERLFKITVPKSQRILFVLNEYDNEKSILPTSEFKWYDTKEECINDIKKYEFSDDCEILIEIVCRNKQISLDNTNDLYKDYLDKNK
tara:strand:- start:72 stop:380 length:309 start_codon:yes stop_codon:yes gene_type:complete